MYANKLKFLTLLCILLVVAIIISIVLVLFVTPKLEITVTNASLTQFNLNSNNNTLYYNLALDVALRNPSPTFRLHYKRVEVTAKYREERFALVTLILPPFNQGTKITTILHPVLQGQSFVRFSEHDLSEFNLETAEGVYSIDVQVSLQISRRILKGIVYKPRGMCMLKVPLSFNQTSTASISFKTTECAVRRH